MRKSTVTNLNSFKILDLETRLEIEKQNYYLINRYGAKLVFDEIQGNLIKVNVRNVNGVKTPKNILLKESYKILISVLPPDYRISILL